MDKPLRSVGVPRDILLMRADAIGDHVLASGLLPLLKGAWPEARITVLCPELVADLFTACPFVAEVIPFNPRTVRLKRNRLLLRWRLRHRYDLALNTVFSRDTLVDFLARRVRADRFVAFQGDASNQSPERFQKTNRAYTELVEVPAGPLHALDQHAALARHLGLSGSGEPQAWFTEKDQSTAETLPLEGEFLAFFPGSGTAERRYAGYGGALKAFLEARPAQIVALGSAADFLLAEEAMEGLPATCLNLCGKTTLPQAAAILSRSRLAMGAESGLAHLAWAVGTPHAVVLGGGHFGRFMPKSPLTTSACLPMDCYGCNWDCRFNRPHCIQDLPPLVLSQAMIAAWDGPSEAPRIYFPLPSPAPDGHGAPLPPMPGNAPFLPSAIHLRPHAPPEA